MLVCRKGSNGHASQQGESSAKRGNRSRKLGEGGPIFFPRRKPSALAEQMLAQTDRVTAYDDLWFAGRPSS